MDFLLLIIRIFIIIILLLVVITKSLNSNFCAFWLVPVTRNILGYLLFCDQSQDGVCFKTFSKDEIWAINEAVLQANTKKATSFNVLGNKRDGTVVSERSASHQCGQGSNPSIDAICGLSLLLVLSLAPRGFSPGTPFSPLLKNQHFQIPIRSGIGIG